MSPENQLRVLSAMNISVGGTELGGNVGGCVREITVQVLMQLLGRRTRQRVFLSRCAITN